MKHHPAGSERSAVRRTSLRHPLVASFAIACAASNTTTNPAALNGTIRALSIVPSSRTACAEDVITARYEATLTNGARVTLRGDALTMLDRSSTGLVARTDQSWQADPNPLATATTGFRLHAAMTSNAAVSADTVIAPNYSCIKTQIDARGIAAGIIRLGVLRSPFHDSIVVASMEYGGGIAQVLVLGPNEMRGGAIRIDATGLPGQAGTNGRSGTDGGPCQPGSPGEDGSPGLQGERGGRVDIVVQSDAPWLADLVTVLNNGGPGGRGGLGGRGGRSGTGQMTVGNGTRTCPGGTTAQRGRPGLPGEAGFAGPVPTVSTRALPLLWSESPLWSSSATRPALEQLIALKR